MTTTSVLYPVANPGLQVSPLDADGDEPMAVCELPTTDGQVRFAVPSKLVDFIELFDGERTVEDAVEAFDAGHPRYTAEKLRRLVSDYLLPKRLLLADRDATAEVPRTPDQRRSFLYIKLPLLSSRFVDPIAQAMRWTYQRPVILTWIPLFVLLHVHFYANLLPRHDLNFNDLNVAGILILMLLSTIGTFIHELGHASAAAYYGCRRLEIGWGLYLVFTVLYTDVSEAWKLPRRQRAMVDLGGIYFQSAFLVAMLVLYHATGNVLYLFGFLFSDLTIASSLNPFLRLDGYWLMSDLFGILNLRQQQLALVRRTAAKVFRWPSLALGQRFALSRSATVALVAYTVFGASFFVYLMTIMFDRVLVRIVVGFPEVVARFWFDLQLGGMSYLEIISGLLEIFWRSMMLIGIVFLLFNVLNKLTQWAISGLAYLRSRQPGPQAEGATQV